MEKSVTGLTNMESSRRSGYGSGSWEHDTAIKAGLRIAIIPFQLSFFLLTHFPFIQLRQKFFLRDKRFPVPRRVATPSLSCVLDSH